MDVFQKKCVITIAAGKQLYFNLAANLARSFRFHHTERSVDFVIVVDDHTKIAPDVAHWAVIVKLPAEAIGKGFELKLNIDLYSDYFQTLFVDADCLFTADPSRLFDRFAGLSFAAIGVNKSGGDWFGSIDKRLEMIGCLELPVFVGALYYLEKCEKGLEVLEIARRFVAQYDEMGMVRLRSQKNEEPLISLGMSLAGLKAVDDLGDIKCDCMNFSGPVVVDVMKGECLFHRSLEDSYTLPRVIRVASPTIAHFNDSFSRTWMYRREARRLRLLFDSGFPLWLSYWLPIFTIEFPGRLIEALKAHLRPIYRALFGYRKLTKNERVNE